MMIKREKKNIDCLKAAYMISHEKCLFISGIEMDSDLRQFIDDDGKRKYSSFILFPIYINLCKTY